MGALKMIPLVLRWLPHVVSAVSLIEVLASDKAGPEKKRAAMIWLQRTSEKMNLPWGPQVMQVLSHLVDASVGVANLVGYFKTVEDRSGPPSEDEVAKFVQENL
jgi:hypothetical protein